MMRFVRPLAVIMTEHHLVSRFDEIDKILPIFNSLRSKIKRGILYFGVIVSKLFSIKFIFFNALLFFSASALLTSNAHAQANNSHNCMETTINDVICPQNTDIAPPGSAENPFGIPGTDVFGSGSPLFSGALGGVLGGGDPAVAALNALLDGLPPNLRQALLSQLASMDLTELTAGDITTLVGLFTSLQAQYELLDVLGCGGGTLNGDFLVYAQNAFAQSAAQIDLNQLMSGGLSIGALTGTFNTDIIAQICAPPPPAPTGPGTVPVGSPTTPGGTGTATSPPAAPTTPPGTVPAPTSVTDSSCWTQSHSEQAFQIARTDNAGGGYCAKGVANIMLNLGFSVTRGNAHDWDNTLPSNGWTLLNMPPEQCPPGSILWFDSDVRAGKPLSTYSSGKVTGGAKYGHVEIVTTTSDGQRLYVSDKARSNWGGTVPHNYGGCYTSCP